MQVEIIQLIGSDDILGLLRDLPRLPRQQLRADGRIQHAREGILQQRILAVRRRLAQDQPDGALVQPAVDAVHAQVVAPIGGKAQGQFAQIAGTHHQPAMHVRQIHQYLGPFARLRVFKGGVMPSVMAYILKMPGYVSGDVDL